jgi:hypothetical protein
METENSKKERISNFCSKYNIMMMLCNHIVGTQHTRTHRRIAGLIFMVIGVYIAGYCQSTVILFKITGDVVGFGLHGIGLMPYIEVFEGKKQKENINNKNDTYVSSNKQTNSKVGRQYGYKNTGVPCS